MSTPVQAELPFKLRLKLLPTLRRGEMWRYFGPAFVASVAYVDPGNFATNIEGGSRFGQRALDKIATTAAKRGITAGMYFIPPEMDPNFFVQKGFKFFTMPWGPWAKAGIQNGLSGIKR